MHLEKLLLIGTAECGLAKFRSSWLGSNYFSPFPNAAQQPNSITDSYGGIFPNEPLPEIEPTRNYENDRATNTQDEAMNRLAQFRSSWLGSNYFSLFPKAAYPQNSNVDSNAGIISNEQLPEIEPHQNYDNNGATYTRDKTLSGLASFRASWLGSNYFSPFHQAAYPQNSVADSNVGISNAPLPEIEPSHNNDVLGMIVHDDLRSTLSSLEPVFQCEQNEYEISIAMGSDLWSGTDDEVEIRFYFLDGSVSEWFDLRIPMYNAFERLAIDTFCVQPQQEILSRPSFIGLRKFGRDQMKIESIMVSTMISSTVFNVGHWIRTNEEFIFNSSELY